MKILCFHLICDKKKGMGHFFRALTVSKFYPYFKIYLFIENTNIDLSKFSKLKNLKILFNSRNNILKKIKNINPDIIINDRLNTKKNEILNQKSHSNKIINFEDIGSGSKYCDILINEIYEKRKNTKKNQYWGNKYFILRDEFLNKKNNYFKSKISEILLTFGGSDKLNLSKKMFIIIKNLCENNNIRINIVVGPGYSYYENLLKIVKVSNQTINAKQNHTLTKSPNSIAKIMQKCQFAISSNGRTTFELAHINLPAIVISQHQREMTHNFSTAKNGFVNLGLYKNKHTEKKVFNMLKNIITNESKRKILHYRMKKFNFNKNKSLIKKIIHSNN